MDYLASTERRTAEHLIDSLHTFLSAAFRRNEDIRGLEEGSSPLFLRRPAAQGRKDWAKGHKSEAEKKPTLRDKKGQAERPRGISQVSSGCGAKELT